MNMTYLPKEPFMCLNLFIEIEASRNLSVNIFHLQNMLEKFTHININEVKGLFA